MPTRFWVWVAFVSIVSIITPPYTLPEIMSSLFFGALVLILPVYLWIIIMRRPPKKQYPTYEQSKEDKNDEGEER